MADMIGFTRLAAPTAFVTPVLAVPQMKQPSGVISVSNGSASSASSNTPLPRHTMQDRAATRVALELVSSEAAKAELSPPPPLDPDVQTGPPPTFEATLLQLEAQLRMSLARIDAARGLKSDDAFKSVAPEAVEPAEAPQADVVVPDAVPATAVFAAPEPAPAPEAGEGDEVAASEPAAA